MLQTCRPVGLRMMAVRVGRGKEGWRLGGVTSLPSEPEQDSEVEEEEEAEAKGENGSSSRARMRELSTTK